MTNSRQQHLQALTARLKEPSDEMLEAAARKVLTWMRNGSQGNGSKLPAPETEIVETDEDKRNAGNR